MFFDWKLYRRIRKMIKKTLPLCVVLVMMLAGIASATEWPHVSFTLPTDTWGDLTFHQTDPPDRPRPGRQ